MGVYNATVITNAGQNLIASAIAGGQAINFTAVKTSTHVYPAGTALQNLTSLSDVKQTVAPTSVDVYNNNVVQVSARVPNTGIATAYLINTIGLFGSAGGAETLIAVLTAQTPDEVPVFDAEAPAAFIFNIQMTIQNADEVVFEVNDTGTATVADLNRVAQPFTGATASAAGSVGRVPAPAAGANKKFLCGDGTWTAPADMVEDFTSSDVADGSATAWTGVNPLTSGETNKSIFAKLSQMFKNIRYLYKLLGTTNISSIGNGTVTDGLYSLNNSFAKRFRTQATGKGRLNTQYWQENTCDYNIMDNICVVMIAGHLLQVIGYSEIIIGEDFPPSMGRYFCISSVITNDNKEIAIFSVNTEGKLSIHTRAPITQNTTINGSIMYVLGNNIQ